MTDPSRNRKSSPVDLKLRVQRLSESGAWRLCLALPDPALLFDARAGLVLGLNGAAEALFGRSAAQAVGAPLRGLLTLPPEALDAPGDRRMAAEGHGPDGACFPVELSLAPLVEAALRGAIWVAFVHAERAQASPAARWRSLVEQLPDVITVADRSGHIQFVNHLPDGDAVDDLLGQDVFAFLPERHRAQGVAYFEQCLRTRQAVTFEIETRRLDGSLAWDQISMGPLLQDGDVVGVVAAHRDVTQQRRLRERESLLAQAEWVARVGSWEMTLDPYRYVWSDGFYRLLGLEPGTVEPSLEVYLQRLHPADRADHERDASRYLLEPRPFAVDRRVIRPDGTERVLHLMGRFELDGEGRPVKAFGIAQDITEQRRIERLKDEFLAVVSHELRTPLTAVAGPIDILARGQIAPESPEGQALLEMAARNVVRMRRLVDDIFDFNRLVIGALPLKCEPTDAAELAAHALEAMQAQAAAAGVRLARDVRPAALTVDPQRVEQVLTNLLDNAIAFSPPGGTVTVETMAEAEAVRFCVRDEGPGIPVDQQEVVFERLRQLDASVTRRKGGTGLGLSIARGIVEQHGGRIWVEGAPGTGAGFCFELPVSPAR